MSLHVNYKVKHKICENVRNKICPFVPGEGSISFSGKKTTT